MFVILDEYHDEHLGKFDDRVRAIAELERLSNIPWDQVPNRAPCAGWRDCGRQYYLIEYDDTKRPWVELSNLEVLEISANGVQWSAGFENNSPAE